MSLPSNPDSAAAHQNGQRAFTAGLRDPEAVLRAHMAVQVGHAPEYHFVNGFRSEALRQTPPVTGGLDDALKYVAYSRARLPLAERVRIVEIMADEESKLHGATTPLTAERLGRMRAMLPA